jgi:hypothetical protein
LASQQQQDQPHPEDHFDQDHGPIDNIEDLLGDSAQQNGLQPNDGGGDFDNMSQMGGDMGEMSEGGDFMNEMIKDDQSSAISSMSFLNDPKSVFISS